MERVGEGAGGPLGEGARVVMPGAGDLADWRRGPVRRLAFEPGGGALWPEPDVKAVAVSAGAACGA